MAELHPQLRKDTFDIVTLDLCRVLLMNDRRFPWLILVPDRADAREWHHLSEDDQGLSMREVTQAARALEDIFAPDKINIGALGNLVPQLHIHVIARFDTDPAWPGPVWGFGAAEPYDAPSREATLAKLRDAL